MRNNDYRIRVMTRSELDLAIEWAAEEGWNPGLFDADTFFAADSQGFLIGLMGDEPVASISVVKYGDDFGFLGFYIVRPEFRGKGYGLQIWNAGLDSLGSRTVGLDGVVAQQANYETSGFTRAYANIRYQGVSKTSGIEDPQIVPLASVSFNQLAGYDRLLFLIDRQVFLNKWIKQPQSIALGFLSDGVLRGYGVMRQCRIGYKIGPLFADTEDFAERLFVALTAHVPSGTTVFLDVPAVNPSGVALAQRHGMFPVFETARMYRGSIPSLPILRTFGVTSFELG
jgi:GNAT superfamily N-acetyltransferase